MIILAILKFQRWVVFISESWCRRVHCVELDRTTRWPPLRTYTRSTAHSRPASQHQGSHSRREDSCCSVPSDLLYLYLSWKVTGTAGNWWKLLNLVHLFFWYSQGLSFILFQCIFKLWRLSVSVACKGEMKNFGRLGHTSLRWRQCRWNNPIDNWCRPPECMRRQISNNSSPCFISWKSWILVAIYVSRDRLRSGQIYFLFVFG